MFTFFCDTSLLKGQNKQCKDIFRRLIYLIVKFVPPKCTNSPSKLKFYMVFAFNLKFLHTTEFVWSPWQIWVSWHLWYLCIAEVFVVGYFVLQYLWYCKFFSWVILWRKGVDRAAGCLRNFCNKTIQTNLKRHVFGNLAVLAVFFATKLCSK